MARDWQRDRIRQHMFLGTMMVGLGTLTPQVMAQPATTSDSTVEKSATLTLPAGPLGDALFAITNTFGANIITDERLVEGRKAPALKSASSAAEALERVLAGTGLRASKSNTGAYVIEKTSPKGASPKTNRPSKGARQKSTPKQNTPKQSASNQYAQDFDADSGSVEEIVIVGSKTGATRQEVATSVGYFDAERIRTGLIFDVEDIFSRTANATTGSSISGAFSIRGVNTDGVAGSINRANALGSILVNQVALGVSSGNYLKPSLFDAASVEVLRGPQSSLQGPNALIGSVYINYKRPDFDGYQGTALAEVGELGALRLGLMQNVVLAEDTLAARLVLQTHQSNGDVKNTTTGRSDVQRKDQETIRLAVRWQPLGNEDLVFDLNYQHVDSDTNPAGLVVPPPGGDLFDREQPYDVDDEFPADFNLFSLEADWRINDNWLLSSVTGASKFSLGSTFDGDLSAFDFLAVNANAKEEIFSQELRVTYDTDNVTALLGLFYSDADYNNNISGNGIFPDGMGGFMPFINTSAHKENIEQKAVFGNLIWRPLEAWAVTLGARFNNEDRNVDDFSNNNGFISDLSASASFSQFIPSVNIAYDLSDTARIGVSYSRGFQAGGISFAFFQGQSVPYDEEFVNNYEFFLRYQSSDGKLLVNANVFHLDWYDQQVVETLPGGVPEFDDITINAGESKITGAELEVEWQPNQQLNFYASFGIVDTEFKKFIFNGIDYAGTSFPQSPKFTATLGGHYVSESGFFASANYNYTDGTFSRLVAPTITKIGERHLVSSRIGYQYEGWQAYVWGTNLLNSEYELLLQDARAFGIPGAYGSVGAPRTVGVGLQLDW